MDEPFTVLGDQGRFWLVSKPWSVSGRPSPCGDLPQKSWYQEGWGGGGGLVIVPVVIGHQYCRDPGQRCLDKAAAPGTIEVLVQPF